MINNQLVSLFGYVEAMFSNKIWPFSSSKLQSVLKLPKGKIRRIDWAARFLCGATLMANEIVSALWWKKGIRLYRYWSISLMIWTIVEFSAICKVQICKMIFAVLQIWTLTSCDVLSNQFQDIQFDQRLGEELNDVWEKKCNCKRCFNCLLYLKLLSILLL